MFLSRARAFSTSSVRLSSGASVSNPVRILIVDGYAPEGRADLEAGGASTAGKLYDTMLKKAVPHVQLQNEIFYPADMPKQYPDLKKFDAIAWTGCSLTIHNKEDPRVIPQIELAKKGYQLGLPQFGSCWAAQIAVTAAGGRCAVSPNGREMGLARKITLSAEGRSHPMYFGKPTSFDGFISHEDEITHLPRWARRLAGNQHTDVQAVSVSHLNGEFWGLQYHPEYDLHELARLVHCRRAKLMAYGFFKSMENADSYVSLLESIHRNPKETKDIKWLLGVDEDVLSEDVRLIEVKNWMRHLVLPFKYNRG